MVLRHSLIRPARLSFPRASPANQSRVIKSFVSANRFMSFSAESSVRPEHDKVNQDIADYVHSYTIDSDLAYETARLCLIDTIGCGFEALKFPECVKLLGPVVEGTTVPNGRGVKQPLSYHCFILSVGLIFFFSTRYEGPRNQFSVRSYQGCF